MYNIPEIFPKGDKKYACVCAEIENISHIYNYEILSTKIQDKISYGQIFNGNINQQIKGYQLVRKNKINLPCGPDEIHCNQQWII